MNPFAAAFANTYIDGQKARPDLATTYQETAPQPDYGFSFGGQSMGQTASQAPQATPYTPPAAPTPAPNPNGFAFGGQAIGQTAADAQDQYGFSQKQYADIKANWEAHRSDPSKIMGLMKDYGVDAAALSRATGLSFDEVGNYLKTNGAQNGFGGYSWGQTPASNTSPTNSPPHQFVNLGISNQAYTPNPYLTQQADAIRNQVNQNLQRNILPQISGNSMMVGGYGGSRQGVVEANALNDANQGLSNALANLYGTDYTNAMNRNLQQQSLDNSYNLGIGNLGLGAINANNSFFTAQRGQDLQAAGLGAQLTQMGNQGFLNQGQGMFNIGNTYQNAPWQTVGNFGNTLNQWGNQTGSVSGSQSSNPWASALGGALGGAQLYNMFR